MRPNDLALRHTLLLIAASVSGLALALHLLVQVAVTVRAGQAEAQSRYIAIAQVLAGASASALHAGDARAAADSLAGLRERPEITSVALRRPDGSLLAGYPVSSALPEGPGPTTLDARGGLITGALVVEQPVVQDGMVRGSLRMDVDLNPVRRLLYLDAALALASAVLALGIALVVALRLFRPVAERLKAQASRAVAEESSHLARQAANPAGAAGGAQPDARPEPSPTALQHRPGPAQNAGLPATRELPASASTAPPLPVLLAMQPGAERDGLAGMFARLGTPVGQHDTLDGLLAWLEARSWPRAGLVVLDCGEANMLQAGSQTLCERGVTRQTLLLVPPADSPLTGPQDALERHNPSRRLVGPRASGVPATPGASEMQPARLHFRVLLAEDNQVNREIATAMLMAMDCKVTQAHDGAQALAAAIARDIDLVLMDCQMPVMDGFEATRRIRAWEQDQPGRTRLPIVALTANAMAGDREACLAAGMDDYLVKPVSSSRLAETLARHLAGRGQPAPPSSAEPADAPPATITTPPVYDPSVLAALPMVADGSHPHFVRDMQRLFAQSTTRTLADIEAAMARSDGQELLRLLHSMNSASAQVGAMELSALARDCEHALRAGRPPAPQWPAQLRQSFERLLEAWPEGVRVAEAVR